MNNTTSNLTSKVEADLIRNNERMRLRALINGDMVVARQLHAPDFQLITPIGASLSKDEYLGAIASGYIKYLVWEPEEIDVRLYNEAAIIRYQAQLEIVFNGHKVPLSRYWHTDSYELRSGSWQVVWSQATSITTHSQS